MPVTAEVIGEQILTIESWVTSDFSDCQNTGIDGQGAELLITNIERSIGDGNEPFYPGEEVSFKVFSFDQLPNSTHSITPIFGDALEVTEEQLLNISMAPEQKIQPYLEHGECSLKANIDLPSFCVFTDENGLDRLCNLNTQTCPCTESIKVGDDLPFSWKGSSFQECSNECELGTVEGFTVFANTQISFRVSEDPNKTDVTMGLLFLENSIASCENKPIECLPQVAPIVFSTVKRVIDPVSIDVMTNAVIECNTAVIEFQINVENLGVYDSILLKQETWDNSFENTLRYKIDKDTTLSVFVENIGKFESNAYFSLAAHLNGYVVLLNGFSFFIDSSFGSEVVASQGSCGDECFEFYISTQNTQTENLTYHWFDGSTVSYTNFCPESVDEDIYVIVDNPPCGSDTFYFNFDQPITYDFESSEVVCFRNQFVTGPQDFVFFKDLNGGISNYKFMGDHEYFEFDSRENTLSIFPDLGLGDTTITVEFYIEDAIGCTSEVSEVELDILAVKL